MAVGDTREDYLYLLYHELLLKGINKNFLLITDAINIGKGMLIRANRPNIDIPNIAKIKCWRLNLH